MLYFYIGFGIYIVVISLFAYFATITDKRAAEKKKKRIREKTLFLISILGGSVAMFLTMKKVRHKTKHLKFMAGIPLIIILQIALAALIVYLVWKQTGSFDFLLP